MEKKISLALAKEISIKKWEGILENLYNGEFYEPFKFLNNYPDDLKEELREHHRCGFCLRHNYCNFQTGTDKCYECEFGALAGNCPEDGSLYDQYQQCEDDSDLEGAIEVVEEMLEIMKSIEDE
jgi:hypothetical protein